MEDFKLVFYDCRLKTENIKLALNIQFSVYNEYIDYYMDPLSLFNKTLLRYMWVLKKLKTWKMETEQNSQL